MKRLLALALLLLASQAVSASAGLRSAGAATYAPGELLVFFNAGQGLSPIPGATAKVPDARAALHLSVGTQLLERIDEIDVHRVKLAPGADPAAVTALYLQSPLVKQVTPNVILHALDCGTLTYFPNDIFYDGTYQPWYHSIGADLAFSDWAAGCITLSSQVTVAVVDTGLFEHSELSGLTVPGVSFVNGVSSTNDDEGHGTFVAGVLAAGTNNGAGFAGTFFDGAHIRIMPIKVLNFEGEGTDSAIAQGILYAADHGAQIINMSLGSSVIVSAIQDAVSYAYNKGLLIVASAGNHHTPLEPGETVATSYPAAYSNVVSVAALDHNDTTTFYSNSGKVDIAAPGGDGAAFDNSCGTNPSGYSTEIWGLCNADGQYTAGAGTSFACPMVSAAAALLLSQDSTRNNGDLLRILGQTTDPASPADSAAVGAGRVNVYKALSYGKGPDSAPGISLKIYNWPNPFNPTQQATNFTFSLSQRMDVDLRVVDVAGDLVYSKHLDASQTFAGDRANRVSWDGRNGVGALVANGVYIVSISAGGKRASNRVAVLK